MNTVRSQSLNHSHALLSDGDPATRRGVHTRRTRGRADARARPGARGARGARGGAPRAVPRPLPGGGGRGVGRARRVCTAEFSAATLNLRILSPHVTRILYTAHPNTVMKFTRTRHGAQRRATSRDAARTLSRTSSACHILSSPNSERPRLTLGNPASRPDRHLCRLGNT